MHEFTDPWVPVEDPSTAKALEAGLYKELPPGHTLEGDTVRAIARTYDDDVLYELNGGPWLVLVHRTYQKPSNPEYPQTLYFSSLDDFFSDEEDDL